MPFCRKIASTRAFFGAATPFHFPRRRNPINCTLARGRNGLFAPLEGWGFRGAPLQSAGPVRSNASLLGSIFQRQPRVREDAGSSIPAPNILSCAPDCRALATRNHNWEKCRRFAVTFSKCRWKVPSTRHILNKRRTSKVGR